MRKLKYKVGDIWISRKTGETRKITAEGYGNSGRMLHFTVKKQGKGAYADVEYVGNFSGWVKRNRATKK